MTQSMKFSNNYSQNLLTVINYYVSKRHSESLPIDGFCKRDNERSGATNVWNILT